MIYSKSKLKPNDIKGLKRSLNDFRYICNSSFQEITLDDRNSNFLTNVFSTENISCESKIEQPYYSCKIHKVVCTHCGKSNSLLKDGIAFPQCTTHCKDKLEVKITKRKSVKEVDINNKSNKRRV